MGVKTAVLRPSGACGAEIQGEGGCLVSISLTVYDMSRTGEHIKCMTHKSVCASVPHQRPAEWAASTAAGGIKKNEKKKTGNFVLYLVWLSN